MKIILITMLTLAGLLAIMAFVGAIICFIEFYRIRDGRREPTKEEWKQE